VTAQDGHKSVAGALDAYQAALAAEGDQRAFELLYKRWHPKLMRFALRQTGNAEAAKDVMQDAAMAMARNISRLEDPERFSAWAYTIVRRRASDHIGRVVKDRQGLSEFTAQVTTETAPLSEEVLSVQQALRRLAKQDRMLLTLFYVDGLKGAEMAAAMGIPLGTLKSRLFAARAKLKTIYENKPKGEEDE
jgi:RNA polymerase sigma-70 factor (ECF subfamily)